jgi:hypothetical protein
MSNDLEHLLINDQMSAQDARTDVALPLRISQTNVHIEFGRIQDCVPTDSRSVVALPANEYFDDECITDSNSSLGAFVQHHFPQKPQIRDFIRRVRVNLAEMPSQRVPRAERRIDDSYGIGKAILLNNVEPDCRVILVSATTERTGIGLRAEPHFLYAALEGVVEAMNENRLNSLTMPVLVRQPHFGDLGWSGG